MASDDDGDLFESVEQGRGTARGREPLAGDDPVLPGSGSLDGSGLPGFLKRWLRDLTYDEVHALVVGFCPLYMGFLLLSLDAAPAVARGCMTLALALAAAAVGYGRLRTSSLGYIVREPHYLLGAQAIAGIVGAVMVTVSLTAQFLAGVLV